MILDAARACERQTDIDLSLFQNTTDDEMEAVMQEYRRLVAEQNRRDNPPGDPEEEESTIEIPSSALEQGKPRSRYTAQYGYIKTSASFQTVAAKSVVTGGPALTTYNSALQRARRRLAINTSGFLSPSSRCLSTSHSKTN